MIANINYKGHVLDSVENLPFRVYKPKQFVCKFKKYSLVIFQNGNCRVMGCKKPLSYIEKPIRIKIDALQSITVTFQLSKQINIYKLSQKMQGNCMFDPEIFPALRYTKYDPMCVNVFSNGKVVVLGIKSFDCEDLIQQINDDIVSYV